MSVGLPHSEISGSKGILTSPELIAEYHVLHRLLLPRHPPNALKALDSIQKKKVYRRIWKPNSNGVWQLKSKGLMRTRTVQFLTNLRDLSSVSCVAAGNEQPAK